MAADLSAERLDELNAEHGEIITVTADIAAADAPAKLLEAAGGQVDVLVNNAGIMDGFLPAAEIDDATLERVLDINVASMVRLIRAVVPGMAERKSGSIVNVSSEASLRGSISGVAYAASKHAVVGITQNTAAVYRHDGIRCNAVAPGAVKTNIEAPMNSQNAAMRLGPVLRDVAHCGQWQAQGAMSGDASPFRFAQFSAQSGTCGGVEGEIGGRQQRLACNGDDGIAGPARQDGVACIGFI